MRKKKKIERSLVLRTHRNWLVGEVKKAKQSEEIRYVYSSSNEHLRISIQVDVIHRQITTNNSTIYDGGDDGNCG